MHQFDHASKLAILERWEHTHFLQFSSADSSLLDVAMEHSKVDLVIPKDLPALNKVFEKAFEKVFKINLKSNGIEFFILKSNDIEFYKIYKILIE
jgi:hypothetical protein